jgi:hypothetical protein
MQRVFGYSVQTLSFWIPLMTIRANSRIEYAVLIEMHSICVLEIRRLWNMYSLVDGRAAVFIFNKFKKYDKQKPN